MGKAKANYELPSDHAWIEALAAGLPHALIGLALDGTIMLWGGSAQELYGWSAQEVIGLPECLIAPCPDELSRVMDRVRMGETMDLHGPVRLHKNGCPVHVEGRAVPVYDSRSCISAVLLMELGARNREKMNPVEKVLDQEILASLPHLLWTAQADGKLDYMSPHCHQFLGGDARRCLGDLWLERVHPDDRDRVGSVCKEAVRGKKPCNAEFRLLRHDGEWRWFKGHGVPFFDGHDRLLRWFGSCTDIHDQKTTHQALLANEKILREQAEALKQADRRKDEFLAVLAHELRNPLAPILNAVKLLQLRGPESPDLSRQHGVIERQVSHMARLLDDLLDVTRIAQGKIALRKEPLAVAKLMERAIETVHPLVQKKRQQLQTTLPSSRVRVEGDADRLVQALGNLLANASKFTPEGGRIWLAGEQSGSEVAIAVRDTGCGIDPAQLPRIFDLFAQADGSDQEHPSGGLGIGLTLARSLVTVHQGRIEARSQGPGRGSEFIIRLPVMEGDAGELPMLQSPAPAGHVRRILVVEDVADSAESLAELLELWGYDVRIAYDGREGLSLFADYQPDVTVLDIVLPGLDGYELARRIRQINPDCTLIGMSGYGQESDRQRAEAAGMRHYLVKPVDPKTLQNLLS